MEEKNLTNVSIEDMINTCNEYIHSNCFVYILNRKSSTVFADAIETVYRKINNIEYTFEPVELGLNILTSIVIEFEIDDNLRIFIDYYTKLAKFMNDSTLKSSVISNKIQYLNRFITNSLTLSETIRLSQEVTNRSSNICDWKPISFNLSKHYFDLLRG